MYTQLCSTRQFSAVTISQDDPLMVFLAKRFYRMLERNFCRLDDLPNVQAMETKQHGMQSYTKQIQYKHKV